MVSVIVYGRNDAHGYNLHKRAAISLNCIAEVLSDADDEILFADYNTPNDLPTFVEAIYDTLTENAKSRIRVFRIRPEFHARLIAGGTHLSALEPHSRNIAIRRSNPRNRWLLFTNTDMIFLPKNGAQDLTEAVRDLPDGQYILPRFELPEPLWEAWPRSDPRSIMRTSDHFGQALHLDEVTVSHPYMRFDSPGDFQLATRQAMFDIHGFDERMIHGWHADSNLCKRLYLLYGGQTESLAHRMRGYHCDHTRVATLAHRLDLKLENDYQRFVYDVEDPVAPGQAETWGAPDEPIEELDFENGVQARYSMAVERTLGGPQTSEYHSDANDLRNFVHYHPEHVLPHLAANLTTYPRDARFVYLGNHPRMLDLTARCIVEMGFTEPLRYVRELLLGKAGPKCAEAVSMRSDLLADYAVLIFDFGLDGTGLNLEKASRVTDWPRDLRYSLGAVLRALETCAESAVRKSPEFMVLNANHHLFRLFAAQFLLTPDTPYNTHVRKGRPRMGEERLYRSHAWKGTEEDLRSLFGYDVDDSIATVASGHTIDLTSSGESARFKDGAWGAMDLGGTWTDGSRCSIVFSPSPSVNDDLLVCVNVTEALLGMDAEPIRVQVIFEGKSLVRWEAATPYGLTTFKALLPVRLMAGKQVCRLTFHIENPQSPRLSEIGEDPRELGVKIQRIAFTVPELETSLGQQIDFTKAGGVANHIEDCWTDPDDLGVWTLGPIANLSLRLTETVESSVFARFVISDMAVSREYPQLKVEVQCNGEFLTEWTFGPHRSMDVRRILLPFDVVSGKRRIDVAFHLNSPRTPMELEWPDTDQRALGFRLTKLGLHAVHSNDLGKVIDLTTLESAAGHLELGWGLPDRYGVWTIGPKATLSLRVEAQPVKAVAASFVISDCMVSKNAPELPVLVKANGKIVAEWKLKHRNPHRRIVHLPADVFSEGAELTLAFELPQPRSPLSMGWSEDSRPLGLRLTRVLVGKGNLKIPEFDPETRWGRKLRNLLRFTRLRIRTAFQDAN